MNVFRPNLILLAALCLAFSTIGQTFESRYGGVATQEGVSCIYALPDGSVLLGGHRNDSAAVYKVSPDGNILWTVVLDRPSSRKQRVFSLTLSSDNYILGAGYNGTSSSAPQDDGFWFKLDPLGNVIWARRESEINPVPMMHMSENPSTGSYAMLSTSTYYSGSWSDLQMFEIDQLTGNTISVFDKENLAPIPFIDDLHNCIRSPGMGIYAVGRTYLSGSPISGSRLYLARYDLSMNLVWAKTYIQPAASVARLYGYSIAQRGNRICLGYFGDHSGTSANYVSGLHVTDLNGNPIWCKSYDVPSSISERNCSVSAHPLGYNLAAFYTNASSNLGIFVVNTDTLGNPLWVKTFDYPGADLSFELWGGGIVSSGGSHWIATNLVEGSNQDILLVRTDSLGNVDCHAPGTVPIVVTTRPNYQNLLLPTSSPDPFSASAVAGRFAHLPDPPCLPISLLGNDTTVCGSLLLDATVGIGPYTYEWQDGSTLPTLNVTASGTYWVNVSKGCCTYADTITVLINPTPNLSLGLDTTICSGDSVLLSAVISPPIPISAYLWSTGATGSSLTVNTAGSYWLEVTAVGGCVTRDTFELSVSPNPIVDLGTDTTICEGSSLLLDAGNPGCVYDWSIPAGTQIISVAGAGLYSVTVTNATGCASEDSVVILVSPVPIVDLGNDTTLCLDDSLLLNVFSPGMSFLWSSGSTLPQEIAFSAGTFSVTVTDTATGCATVDTIVVDNFIYGLDILADTIWECFGDSVSLDASASVGSYLWSTGEVDSVITVAGPGIYAVTVTFPSGCALSDTAVVDDHAPPVVFIGSDTSICTSDTLLLLATGSGYVYLWSTGETTATISAAAGATYSVIVTDTLTGCSNADTISIGTLPLPTVDLGPDSLACLGDTFTLDATGSGYVYLWSTGETTATISAAAGATYSVIVTDTLTGCSNADTISIGTLPLPTVDLGPDSLACLGDTLTLNAGPSGAAWLWSTGAVTEYIQVTAGGIYSVTVTSASGCISTDTVALDFQSLPATLLGPDTAFCSPGSMTIGLDLSGVDYLWSTGSTDSAVTLSNPMGWYWVEITYSSGCVTRDSVFIESPLSILLSLPDSILLCEGSSIELIPDPGSLYPDAEYLWSDGSILPSLWLSSPGMVALTVSSDSLCPFSDSVHVILKQAELLDLGPDLELCKTTKYEIHSNLSGFQCYWSTGDSAPSITVTQSGAYSLMASNECQILLDTVHILLLPGTELPFVPNAFTPNGDGLNDHFGVTLQTTSPDGFVLSIFDRWGMLICELKDVNALWDGTFKGEFAPEGIYVWKMNYLDCVGQPAETNGGVSLLR